MSPEDLPFSELSLNTPIQTKDSIPETESAMRVARYVSLPYSGAGDESKNISERDVDSDQQPIGNSSSNAHLSPGLPKLECDSPIRKRPVSSFGHMRSAMKRSQQTSKDITVVSVGKIAKAGRKSGSERVTFMVTEIGIMAPVKSHKKDVTDETCTKHPIWQDPVIEKPVIKHSGKNRSFYVYKKTDLVPRYMFKDAKGIIRYCHASQ